MWEIPSQFDVGGRAPLFKVMEFVEGGVCTLVVDDSDSQSLILITRPVGLNYLRNSFHSSLFLFYHP